MSATKPHLSREWRSTMSAKALRLQKPSRSQKRYALGCTGKSRFRSLEHAKEAKERIRYIAVSEKSDTNQVLRIPIRAYQCSNCKGFHLTSRPEIAHWIGERNKEANCGTRRIWLGSQHYEGQTPRQSLQPDYQADCLFWSSILGGLASTQEH